MKKKRKRVFTSPNERLIKRQQIDAITKMHEDLDRLLEEKLKDNNN